jgi:hypothetical protein
MSTLPELRERELKEMSKPTLHAYRSRNDSVDKRRDETRREETRRDDETRRGRDETRRDETRRDEKRKEDKIR